MIRKRMQQACNVSTRLEEIKYMLMAGKKKTWRLRLEI